MVLRPYLISLQNLRSGSKINQCDCAWESIHMFFWPCPLLSPVALRTDHSPFWGVPESRCDHGPGEEEKEIRTIQPGVSWHHRSPGATTDASCCHYNHPTPVPTPSSHNNPTPKTLVCRHQHSFFQKKTPLHYFMIISKRRVSKRTLFEFYH